jgi:hypothetical protein
MAGPYLIVPAIVLGVLIAFRYGLLRAAPPVWRFLDAGPWGDALAYFLQIQYYRRYSGAEPDTRCLFRGNALHTPSWYHRFALTLWSDATLWSKPWVPNLLLYTLGAVALLALSPPILGGSMPAVGLLALVFLAQTDNSRFDERTIHYVTIQPRLLGLVSLSVHAALFALMPSLSVTVVGGTLALLVALNTSVFSRQVACFVLPLAALLSWNAIPVLTLGIAVALSLVLNRSEFVESCGAHWRYARWYFRNFRATRAGSGWRYLIRRTLAPAVTSLPQYADSVLALLLLLWVLRVGRDPFAARAAAMIGAALIVCGVTALRRFASLGECWRYVSFTCWILTPIAIVHAVLALRVSLPLAYVVASAALMRNVWLSFRSGEELRNPNGEVAALLHSAFAGDSAPPAVWWSAHYRYGSIAVALGCGAATFEIQGTDLSEEVMMSLFARYPYLHCNEAFFDAHRVTHLLISKSEWPEDLYGSIDRLVGGHRVLAENSRFVILARAHA